METAIRQPQDVSEQAHQYQKRAIPTAEKGGYTATLQNLYGELPTSPEEHHWLIKDIQTIVQGMQTKGYDLEGLTQDNAVLYRSNSAVMADLEQMTVTMNAMQAQLKTLASA